MRGKTKAARWGPRGFHFPILLPLTRRFHTSFSFSFFSAARFGPPPPPAGEWGHAGACPSGRGARCREGRALFAELEEILAELGGPFREEGEAGLEGGERFEVGGGVGRPGGVEGAEFGEGDVVRGGELG